MTRQAFEQEAEAASLAIECGEFQTADLLVTKARSDRLIAIENQASAYIQEPGIRP